MTGKTDSDLARYRVAREWHRENPSEIFPTWASFEWFVRQNRAELISSGEMIVRRGSVGTLIGPEFERVVIQILRRKSAAQKPFPKALAGQRDL